MSVQVPNLEGLTVAAATAALTAAGLALGTIGAAYDETIPVGNVSSQTPPAYSLVAANSQVDLGVSVVAIPFDIDQTLISQYANSPIITAIVENMAQWLQPDVDWANFYALYWNLDTAQGQGLDYWGDILGVGRLLTIPNSELTFGFQDNAVPPDVTPFNEGPFNSRGSSNSQTYLLNDTAYRTLLFAKALSNISAMSAPALNQLLQNLFPGRGQCYVLDGLDMSMQVVFEFSLTAVEFAILTTSGAFPHPGGVKFSIVVIPDTTTFEFFETGEGTPFGTAVFY